MSETTKGEREFPVSIIALITAMSLFGDSILYIACLCFLTRDRLLIHMANTTQRNVTLFITLSLCKDILNFILRRRYTLK